MIDDHSKKFQCLFSGLYGIELMYILVNPLDLNTYEMYVYEHVHIYVHVYTYERVRVSGV